MSYKDVIENVKKNPVLWKSSHPKYRTNFEKEYVWRQIANDMKVDKYRLKNCWDYLRGRYSKLYKKTELLKTNIAAPGSENREVHWQYYNDLGFLQHEIIRRHAIKNNDEEPVDREHDSGSENVAESCNSCPPQDVNWQEDPDYIFLMSLLPLMENLSELQKLEFRGQVNDWLLQFYIQNEYPNTEHCPTDEDSKV